jgi:PAS domain S-box-containing protein
MVIAIQFFTTALVIFTGILAMEVGSTHLNEYLGSKVFHTYGDSLRELFGLSHGRGRELTESPQMPLYQIREALYRMRGVVLGGGVVAFVAGLILYYTIRRPIKELMGGVQAVASGNYKALVRLPAQDEFAPLVEAFNRMVDSVNKSQEQLAKVFFAADDAMFSTDPKGNLLLWGGGCERMFGLAKEEISGRRIGELLAPGVPAEVLDEVRRDARNRGRWEGEIQFRGRGGRVFDGWCVATNLRNDEGQVAGYLHVVRDVTDKKLMEMQLIQSEKMASVGELAAGVAHEINNPLSGILSNAEFLQEEIPEEETERHEEIREIMANSERIRVIVRDLLSFSRQKDSELFGPVDVAKVIQASLNLTMHQMTLDNIRVIRKVPEDLPLVHGNANKIEQVLINVLSNARYALNQKYPKPHEEKILEMEALAVQREGRPHVRIRCTDHGTGIPREIMDRIVHPFFTTKEQGKGTGLGMSISYHIVRDHGGALGFESEEGRYTRVSVDLPVGAEEERTDGQPKR